MVPYRLVRAVQVRNLTKLAYRSAAGMVDEWWEQPAATAVDWVTIDGQNISAWLNLVKQLQMALYDHKLL
ncbi:hypothetical protein GW17_00006365 [Ensete ventricosum]|nr:hypothetical protein GW17_00006365 [Ensete ventricosum]